MENQILELENLIDNEIEEYKSIEKLYIDKREILKSAKSEELLKIDSNILDVVQNIDKISSKRKTLAQKMDIMSSSMSEIIGFLKSNKSPAVTRFEEKKNELCELSKKISELEKINFDLAKHGLQFTKKTLEAIFKGAAVSTQEYNASGQSISTAKPEMSSIIEEA